MAALKNKQIYVIGPLKAQNELMAFFLEQETGASCRAVRNFGGVQTKDDAKGGNESLALWDCFGRDTQACLSELDADAKTVLTQHYVALFNLIPWLGVEEEAVARGARGFFYLEEPLDQFIQGLHAIFDGELWAPRKIMSSFITKKRKPDRFQEESRHLLTRREVELLQMVAAGYSNSRIADELCISPHTVKTHLYNAYKKINAPGRLQAALWAVKNL